MEPSEPTLMCDGQQTTARSFHPCTYSLITDRPIDSVCISMIGGQAKAHLDNSPSSPAWKSDSSISACAAWLIRAVVAGLKTLIPRRLDEPTGPFELVFDLLIGVFIPRGASKRKIASIPTMEFDLEDNDRSCSRCAVCLGDFEGGDLMRLLPCTHTFHSECVDPYVGLDSPQALECSANTGS